MKVIHLMGYSVSRVNLGVDVLAFQDEWHVQVAKQVAKRTSKYQIECWQPERTFKEVVVQEVDGVTRRFFPAFYVPVRGLRRYEISLPLLRALKHERGEQTLLHIYSAFSPPITLVCCLFGDLPIVMMSQGGRYNRFMRLVDRVDPFQRMALRNVDWVMVHSEAQREYLARMKGNDEGFDLQPAMWGVDFDLFKPTDRIEARRRLGLPLDKKIVLHVGRLYGLKGWDIILGALGELKKTYDIELVLAGYHPGDPWANRRLPQGVRAVPVMPQAELVPYYCAADVWVAAPFDEAVLAHMGTGIAPIEAAACGTPVVTPSLRHFPAEIVPRVGLLPRSPDDMARCIARVLADPGPYRDCREAVKRHFGWDAVVGHLVDVYDGLFEGYHGRTWIRR